MSDNCGKTSANWKVPVIGIAGHPGHIAAREMRLRCNQALIRFGLETGDWHERQKRKFGRRYVGHKRTREEK